MPLDRIAFQRTGASAVNLNTPQKSDFCARLQMAAGGALYICPVRPGTVS